MPIFRGSLGVRSQHQIRIIAPTLGGDNTEQLQFQGIWIDEVGQLLPFDTAYEIIKIDGSELSSSLQNPPARKMLEIVTDLPGSMAGRNSPQNPALPRGMIGGVLGWEYLLGEMFGSDHSNIGMLGMCLIQECIGGSGSPAGLGDVFFRRSHDPLLHTVNVQLIRYPLTVDRLVLINTDSHGPFNPMFQT